MQGRSNGNILATWSSLAFVGLAMVFLADLWGRPSVRPSTAEVLPVFYDPATVRLSAAEMFEQELDTSGMDCLACHETGKPLVLKRDEESNLILPPAHQDLVFARMNCVACHDVSEGRELAWDDEGRTIVPEPHRQTLLRHGNSRLNNDCFNCHDRENLAQLKLRDGTGVAFTESVRLCSECHGPTHRDWQAGVHGRTSGHWNRETGEASRKACTACHDPHHPAFPRMKPAPAPQPPAGWARIVPLETHPAHE